MNFCHLFFYMREKLYENWIEHSIEDMFEAVENIYAYE